MLRESRELADIPASLAEVADLFDLRYLLGIINSRFMRDYLASNKLEGTREGRIYPDVWKRLPIKVASTEQQQQVAILVDALQEHYRQLAALPTPSSIAADPNIIYRDIQAYLVRQDLRFVGNIQSTIAEKPMLRDERLILRRQPLTYLVAPAMPELLRYVELYLTQLHPELQGYTWAEARTRIQIPPTLSALRSFLAAIDAAAAQEQQVRTGINTLLVQMEELIAMIYSMPADAERMNIIRSLRTKKVKEQKQFYHYHEG